jgi:hypothetical protein
MLAETMLRGRVDLAYTHGPPNLGEHQRDDLVQRNRPRRPRMGLPRAPQSALEQSLIERGYPY